MKQKNDLTHVLFEAAVVKRIQRTGWQILGDHRENVGEHSFMTAVIAYFIGKQKKADLLKVLTMAVFHDFHEARTGEIDKLAMSYVTRDQDKANADIFEGVDDQLLGVLDEYEKKQSLEAQIAYEANIVALLLELKILLERGHLSAREWLNGTVARLKLPECQSLAQDILTTDPHEWWKQILKQTVSTIS